MRFYYGKQEFSNLSRSQENVVLLTNGLGGYASVTSACSVNRCDQGILVAAVRCPNERIGMVQRVREKLNVDGKEYIFSTQQFTDGTETEEGYRYLNSFCYEDIPVWKYRIDGIDMRVELVGDVFTLNLKNVKNEDLEIDLINNKKTFLSYLKLPYNIKNQ